MTTYSPVGPFTLTTEETGAIDMELADESLDALPLLDPKSLTRTIAPYVALRGLHLALGDHGETRLLRIDNEIVHLGRGQSAGVRFDDYRVSRDHAILVRHGENLRLLDNRSANGTFVNGRRIAATTLSDGDVIELGPVRMQLVVVP